jgi:hypothetical protein
MNAMALILILYSLLSQQDRKYRGMSNMDELHWVSCGKMRSGLVLLVISEVLSAGVPATAEAQLFLPKR